MATTEEIRRRVQEADTARSARRADAAQQVAELAASRAVIAGQLEDVERQLGEVLAEAREVMDLDELAVFTDLPVADLTRWIDARTIASRGKRKKPATVGTRGARSTARRTPTAPARAAEPVDALPGADTSARAMAG